MSPRKTCNFRGGKTKVRLPSGSYGNRYICTLKTNRFKKDNMCTERWRESDCECENAYKVEPVVKKKQYLDKECAVEGCTDKVPVGNHMLCFFHYKNGTGMEKKKYISYGEV